MKTNFGAIVVAGIGKLGGQVFSRSNAGTVLKRKMSPVNRASQLQLNVRTRMSVISNAWRSLSESQRILWNAFANDRSYTNDFGLTVHLSGFGMFCKVNTNRASISLSMLLTPPVETNLYQISQVSALSLSGDQIILITIAPTIPANVLIKIYASSSINPGISKFYGVYNLIGYIDASYPYPIDISTMYLNKFKAIGAPGQKIFFKFIAIDQISGLESQPFEIVSIISNIDYSNVGLNWSDLGSKSAQLQITRIYYAGLGVVIAGTSNTQGHTLRSTDFGINWTDQGQLGGSSGIYSFDSDRLGTIVLGLGSTAAKIMRSTNYGVSWSDMGNLPTGTYIYSMLSLGEGKWLAGVGITSANLYKSLDNGVTWGLVQNFSNANRIYWLCNCGNGIIVAATGTTGHIYKSTDNGNSWSDKGVLPNGTSIYAVIHLGNGILIAGSGNLGHLHRSIDFGENWSDLGQMYSEASIVSLVNCGNGVALAGSNPLGKILRSVDYGATWANLGQQYGELRITALAYLFNGICLAGTYNHSKILRSTI